MVSRAEATAFLAVNQAREGRAPYLASVHPRESARSHMCLRGF